MYHQLGLFEDKILSSIPVSEEVIKHIVHSPAVRERDIAWQRKFGNLLEVMRHYPNPSRAQKKKIAIQCGVLLKSVDWAYAFIGSYRRRSVM